MSRFCAPAWIDLERFLLVEAGLWPKAALQTGFGLSTLYREIQARDHAA